MHLKKRIVRREGQASKPTFLTAARRALDGIAKIAARIAPRGEEEREKGRAPCRAPCTHGRGRGRGRGRGEKERGEDVSVPQPQRGPAGSNALPEGEFRDIRNAENYVTEAECPTGTAPLAGAADALQPPSDVNSGDQATNDLPEESGFLEETGGRSHGSEILQMQRNVPFWKRRWRKRK